ncbi:PfkB family carbohydrate kinase [Goodfellowiella coeruleoviolacea]|uniref:1-phosphofructokinase n=1 Tax=Goodfellowiella coeruleoviolacea TaxID=334858 RepID=A0AAE3GIU2_9PSEU|nr:PfkB family carbohydrate kinase [Goodfellowiella coeruleoviolacea]MCP2168207.1 1-phosphofructokinase [Goodfellowiella coeruleoviolacea]
MDARVMVFAPSPQLTVTVEDLGGEPDLHLHAGGQGVWQARMIASFGVPVTLCAALGGETGEVLRHLITGGGVDLAAEEVVARNGGYVHDRRGNQGRESLAEVPGDPLSRHELDSLYETTLIQGLASTVTVLSGPSDARTVPAESYQRLAADLGGNGVAVLADLAGDRLSAALRGGLRFLKVSHEELIADGRATSGEPDELVRAMVALREQGARAVVVSRSAEPALALLDDDVVLEVRMPPLHPVETRGAGDSMTAAVAASLAVGKPLTEAVRLGAAAGALNVTRRGLASSRADGVRAIAERVALRAYQPGDR